MRWIKEELLGARREVIGAMILIIGTPIILGVGAALESEPWPVVVLVALASLASLVVVFDFGNRWIIERQKPHVPEDWQPLVREWLDKNRYKVQYQPLDNSLFRFVVDDPGLDQIQYAIIIDRDTPWRINIRGGVKLSGELAAFYEKNPDALELVRRRLFTAACLIGEINMDVPPPGKPFEVTFAAFAHLAGLNEAAFLLRVHLVRRARIMANIIFLEVKDEFARSVNS